MAFGSSVNRSTVLNQVTRLADMVPGPALDTDSLQFTGSESFASAFDVDTIALASVAASNLAAGHATVDRDRVVASFTGHAEVDGKLLAGWAPLSGYYRTSDHRFIQLHCNFDHHRDAVVRLLGCEADRESVQRSILRYDPDALEGDIADAGGIAAKLRTLDEWTEHPHAVATAGLPLITVSRLGDGTPRPADRRFRVLDCTRVIAGPVAGQALAAHGADVLRVGSPHLPSVEMAVVATGFGKRNAFVDLAETGGRNTFTGLLTECDVWLDAYRPGALAGRGFDISSAAPGSVIIRISAFDCVGPWAARRGFDSIVQSTTGIVEAGRLAAENDDPTPLPVQALDFSTGYLAAFAASRLLAHQAEVGGTWLAELSLLRTRNWLVSLGGPHPFEPARPTPLPETLHTLDTPFGAVTAPRSVSGQWPHGPQPLGSSPPRWQARD